MVPPGVFQIAQFIWQTLYLFEAVSQRATIINVTICGGLLALALIVTNIYYTFSLMQDADKDEMQERFVEQIVDLYFSAALLMTVLLVVLLATAAYWLIRAYLA
jgi:formate hydrogenlyase subunit 3/multisubunit Na+/H+ antiporter MnhD subunit